MFTFYVQKSYGMIHTWTSLNVYCGRSTDGTLARSGAPGRISFMNYAFNNLRLSHGSTDDRNSSGSSSCISDS